MIAWLKRGLLTTMFAMLLLTGRADAQRQMETLGRGVVAIDRGGGTVAVSWRLLATDREQVAFNLYRLTGGATPVKVNSEPIAGSTCFVDTAADLRQETSYHVRAVVQEQEQSPSTVSPPVPRHPYLAIPLETLEGHTPNDAAVGDLDGDGEYEIVVKQEMRPRDNSQSGFTGQTKLEAYRLDGTFLWRIDLGRNIREGAHYTPFLVYDLDGDGRAEVACRTADGTVDGQGRILGDAAADWRNARGYILEGPEFLTIFDGKTGGCLASTAYLPPRGEVRSWGDDYGNRVDRFLACIAYLDGRRPSFVMCRGYYTRTVLVAWNWRGGQLTPLWTFDSDDGTPGNRAYRGQGNHGLSVADIDGDGKDEIVYGACAIDDDGRGLYSTGLGHGDAMHLSDLDPGRPGLEVFGIHERPGHEHGANLRDAATGRVLWGLPLRDPGRGLALDIDPRHPGYECWTNDSAGLYNCRGERISAVKPPWCNMGVWWDGDLLRESLDGTRIDKWDYQAGRSRRLLSGDEFGCASNNGSKANPCLVADLLGDWREEVVWRSRDNRELRIFTTTIPADQRLYTLMHDPVYRLSVAWQNVGYNQPPHPGFFLGHGMATPTRPDIQCGGRSPDRATVPTIGQATGTP